MLGYRFSWNLFEVIRYATRVVREDTFIGNKLCFRFENSRTLLEIGVGEYYIVIVDY